MRDPRFYTRNVSFSEFTAQALALRADSVNESERSVEAVLSTETPSQVWDWDRGIIEEVLQAGGAEFGDQCPLLDGHMRYSTENVLGSVRGIRAAADQVTGRLQFADGDEDAESAWNKVRGRHITDVSVGYRVLAYTDIAPNTTATVNGKSYTASPNGLRVTTKWKIKEVSLVPIGADEAAKIRSLFQGGSPRVHKKENAMKKALKRYLVSLGLRAEATDQEAEQFLNTLQDDQLARADTLRNAPDDEPPAPSPEPAPAPAPEPARTAPAADPAEVARQAIRAENARVEQIRRLAGSDIPEDVIQRAINGGLSVERASQEFLTHIRQRPNPVGPGIHVQGDATRDVLSAGLMHRTGMGERIINPRASEETRRNQERLADQGQRFGDMSIVDLCREAIRLDGRTIPMGQQEIIRAAISGGTLAYIFTTSMQAQLYASYSEAPDTTNGWVQEVDRPNFKTNDIITLGKTGSLDKLPPGGTAAHEAISDNREQYKIARYAKQFVIDEQDLINDDLGAMIRVPAEMGLAAARLRPDLVYSILIANANLADGGSLFNNTAVTTIGGHANLTSTALSSAAIKAAVTGMRKQTLNGVMLNINPTHLLVAPTLEWTARENLFSAGQTAAGTAGSVTTVLSRNVVADMNLQLRVDGRLELGVTDPASGTALSGAATKWYLVSGQGQTIEVGYRSGTQRRPQVTSWTKAGVDGQWLLGWAIAHDIGAKAVDYKAMFLGNA